MKTKLIMYLVVCLCLLTKTVGAQTPTIEGTLSACTAGTTSLTYSAGGSGTWSSSTPTVASIDASGVVTGHIAGTSTITFTPTSDPYVTAVVTVNPTGSISGPSSVCAGQSITLTNSVDGGTWWTDDGCLYIYEYHIPGASKTITGNYAGTANITYYTSAGCVSSHVVTVNALAANTGDWQLCKGTPSTLSNVNAYGTWTSNDGGIATVNSSSGEVLGITTGTTVISYTLPTGCLATTTVLIQPREAITGPSSVCAGQSITLSNPVGGGTWWTDDGCLYIYEYHIPGSSKTITGNYAGTANITYYTGVGCVVSHTVTVNAMAANTGTWQICRGLTGTLANVNSGGVWSSNDIAIATVGSATGVVTGVNTGTTVISYTLPTGCVSTTTVLIQPREAITGYSSVCIGKSITLSNAVSGGTWNSPCGCATITSGGVVTGNSAGTSVITYGVSGCLSTHTVTVYSMAANTGAWQICKSTTSTLSNVNSGGIWSSANTAIGTVNSTTGAVTGVSVGTTVISYTLPAGCVSTTTIQILPNEPITGPTGVCKGLSVTLSNVVSGGAWNSPCGCASINSSGVVTGNSVGTTTISYIINGCRTTHVVTINPLAANTGAWQLCKGIPSALSNTNSGGTWSSNNESIATVSSTGVVLGITTGTTVITYTLPTGCAATTQVLIRPNEPITGLTGICVGKSTTLSNAVGSGLWSSSHTSANINTYTGVLTGNSVGTATISYTNPSGCASTHAVTVYALAANTGSWQICRTTTSTLSNVNAGGTWTSANTGIATVDATSGVVTGVTVGTTLITYILPAGCISTTTVHILPKEPITGPHFICLGAPGSILNNSVAASGAPAWDHSNSIAYVYRNTSMTTTVTANYIGTTEISYINMYGCVSTHSVTVEGAATDGTFGGSLALCAGSNTTHSNTITGGTWASSNVEVATVGETTGVVTGVASGTALITYWVTNSCGTTYAVRTLTVNPLPDAGSISGELGVCVGYTTDLDAASGGVWSSTNTDVATVNATTGVVTGVAAGTATISYTVTNSCGTDVASNVVEVHPMPDAGAIVGPTTVIAGLNILLTNRVSGGTWSSSNTGIATVSSTGIVTGVSAGNVVITYTVANYCGTVYVTHAVTVISGEGCDPMSPCATPIVTTLAGVAVSHADPVYYYGGDSGPATSADLNRPYGVCRDAADNTYIADTYNNRVRKVDASGTITTIAGTGTAGYSGDNGAAATATLNQPYGVACDAAGNVYIADRSNHAVRKVNVTTGIITTVAGNGTAGYSGNHVVATAAVLDLPTNLAFDAWGNLFIVDFNNNMIRKIDATGDISNYAGDGTQGLSGDGGAAATAQLYHPTAVACDAYGNVYIDDENNTRIRKVNSAGIITTFAGNGPGNDYYSGDGGPATGTGCTSATCGIFNENYGVAVDDCGNVYVSDRDNFLIRVINTSGVINTYAGVYNVNGYVGDGGAAATAEFSRTYSIFVDASGLYICDGENSVIRKIAVTCGGSKQSPGTKPTVAQPTVYGNLVCVPNPNNGVFTVKGTIPVTKVKDATIEVVDMMGKVLYTDKAEITDGGINKNISLGNELSNGIYFIKVRAADFSTVMRLSLTR